MRGVNALAPTMPRRSALRRSFGEAAADHLDAVHRYLLMLTADSSLAEDLTAETFEKALRSWRRFDPRRGSERTWLCRIGRGVALDHFRAESRRRRREERYALGAGGEDAAPVELGFSPELEAALRSLTAAEREVVALPELDRSIRIGQLRLESETLDPDERLRIQIRLEQQRAARADLLRANTRDRREAATSELTLLLHTREAPAGDERDEGGPAGIARDALRLLGEVGVVALFLAIVLGPVVLLLVLLWLALRFRSRRIETRLLGRPAPAGPPPK